MCIFTFVSPALSTVLMVIYDIPSNKDLKIKGSTTLEEGVEQESFI